MRDGELILVSYSLLSFFSREINRLIYKIEFSNYEFFFAKSRQKWVRI